MEVIGVDIYEADTSGINSLGGFAYQIKVFVLYMLTMDENMQTEFETLDDVTVNKLSPKTIDLNEDKFKSSIISTNGIMVIQVKRKKIDAGTARQILLNWILLEGSGEIVTKYILYTSSEYGNSDILFNISAEDLYLEVLKTTTKKSTIAKVKNRYKKDKDGFIQIYNSIQEKYIFISVDNIDREIDEKCKVLFRKAGVNIVTYYNRIAELLRHMTCEIIEHVNKKESYCICYKEMMVCIEDICSRFTDEHIFPAYSEFKKINRINFSDLQIAKSREYKQLLACEIPQKIIETHLIYGNYYRHICYCYKELNKLSKIRDIEETTYENYEYAKCILQKNGEDTPFQRLSATKELSNSYADSEQVKYGSGIYLTREDEREHQISWEDEDNAKS